MSEEYVPTPVDPGWEDYVLSQFESNEVVEKKNDYGQVKRHPKVNGLRRVARKLIGQIIQESVHTTKSPDANSLDATVEATVVFLPEGSSQPLAFSSVADSSEYNTDPLYRVYPAAMAETRACARAFRKALQLSVASSDELSKVAESDADGGPRGGSDRADSNDLRMLRKACQNANIKYEDFEKEMGIGKGISKDRAKELMAEVQKR